MSYLTQKLIEMIVAFYNSGQLGNRLFYFSHFLALAELKKVKTLCLFFEEYSHHFEGTEKNICGFYPIPKFLTGGVFFKKALRFFLWKIFLVAKKYNWNNRLVSVYNPAHDGEMETIDYSVLDMANDPRLRKSIFTFYNGNFPWYDNTNYSRFHESITTFFRPKEKYRIAAEEFIRNQRTMGDLLVGIHIRRGDYKTFAKGRYYHNDDFYRQKMEQIQDNFPNQKVRFIIASDEKIAMKNFTGMNCVYSGRHFIEDLSILSCCDYLVGPPSTFSSWASFYGQVPLFIIYTKHTTFSMDKFAICSGRPFHAELSENYCYELTEKNI